MKKLTTRQVFAQMLVKLRKNKGISRKTLADSLGVSSASIGYYENAERVPDIEVLVKIADYFNVTCDELLKGVKSPDKNIYKDLWLSDKALNTLRKLKDKEPINSDTQVSYYFEFFNELLERYDWFIAFISNYYQYAIGFNVSLILDDFNLQNSLEIVDTIVDVDNFGFYQDYKFFEVLKSLEILASGFQYKNLSAYEQYYEEKLENKLIKINQKYNTTDLEISKEAAENVKHNPPKE